MTNKHRRFADEYMIDCNATRAYLAAYPHVTSRRSASSRGSLLLQRPDVRAYLEEQMQALHSEKMADAREVLEYLTAVVRGETRAEVVMVEGRGEGVTEAVRISKAPDQRERLKAAELLGRHWGILTNRVKLEAGPVVISGGEQIAD